MGTLLIRLNQLRANSPDQMKLRSLQKRSPNDRKCSLKQMWT